MSDDSEQPSKRQRVTVGPASVQTYGMAALWRSETLCDIKIKVDGQLFSAHKIVLAGSSQYFRALFSGAGSGMSDGCSPCIDLSDMEAEVFQAVLTHIYAVFCLSLL